jgi:long-chain fatty acid transport protein
MGANAHTSGWGRLLAGTLLSGTALAGAAVLVPLAASDANAGGFGLRDQSTVGEGDAFAGVAAGGTLSSMYWNPATMTQIQGGGVEANAAGILAHVDQHPAAGSALLGLGFGGVNDTGNSALVPSAYLSKQISQNFWVGLALNSPFGLATSFNDPWAGRNYGLSSALNTYNAAPSVAWRITDWLSVGVGAQIQFGRADVNLGLGPVGGPANLIGQAHLAGSGWGFGATAGITVTPGPNTTIGVGWRSAVDQKVDGSLNASIPIALPAFSLPATTTLNLPDVVSVGLRHRFDDHWTFLATAEWTNWSRIGTSVVNQAAGGVATIGGSPVALPFQFKDGWFYSIGAEYVLNPKYTLRAGVGYEISPVTDEVRMPILPDTDRVWLSAGFTYKPLPNLAVDVGYTHLFFKDANINITGQSGNPWFSGVNYVGNASVGIDVFSLGFRYQFAPPPPLLTKG